MNDVLLLGSLFMVSCGMILLFLLFHIYGGVHDSLSAAHIGSVYNFRYQQPVTGDYERYLAKVISVRKMTQSEISRLNYTSDYRIHDKEFHRTPTLVTCVMSNGDYRQFYAERSDMCKRPLVAGLLFKAGVAHLF
jgi:hypothetical protein